MESFKQAFTYVSDYCKSNISEIAYGLWIEHIEPIKLEDGTAYLSVKTDFQKGVIESKYEKLLKDGFEHVLGFEVNIVVNSEKVAEEVNLSFLNNEEAPVSENNVVGDYEFTFDTFIVGSSNKFAHAASQAVAADPSRAYNPLFIYGNSGLGKTHLLNAICHEIKKDKPNSNIIYVKGDQFTNELIEAIQSKTTSEFQQKYRKADIFLIDDIQFIGGKESTQEEFFHTFNSIHEAGHQIVLTSDRPPKEIKTLEDRLKSRFEMGLIADIQPPDYETRIAIIRRKAQLLNINLPEDVAEHIANRLKTNIRQLEGVVKKLKAYSLIGTMPSILVAQNAIRDILNDNQPVPVTVERIISEVARTFGVSPQDIRSTKRAAPISKARQAAIYIVRDITQMSTSAIGEEFNRDHTTIVYATQSVEKKLKIDSNFKETVEDIIKNIRNS